MSLFFYYNGTDLGATRVRLGRIAGLQMAAEGGQAGTCDLPIDDLAASLTVNGNKKFQVLEPACSEPMIWAGYTIPRDYAHEDSLLIGSERRITTQLADINIVANFRVIHRSDGNRPAESISARLTWLLGTSYFSHVFDNGEVAYPPALLSASDYRGRFGADVLNDCAARANPDYNWFLYWKSSVAAGQEISLYFRPRDYTGYASTLSISNVLTDLSSTCFAPDVEAKLNRDPSQVYSGVYVTYKNGTYYTNSVATQVAFGIRETTLDMPDITDRATVVARAASFLGTAATEFDRITCTLKLPPSQVNLIMAGHRVFARFTHLPGYETGAYLRVARRTVKQDQTSDEFYWVELELANARAKPGGAGPGGGPPAPPIPFVPSCGTPTYVQGTAGALSGGSGPPSNVTATLGVAPTTGHLLVAQLTAPCPSGTIDPVPATWPSGWTVITGLGSNQNGQPSNTRTILMEFGYKISDGTEQTLNVLLRDPTGAAGHLNYAEYSGIGSLGAVSSASSAHAPVGSPGDLVSLPSITLDGTSGILFFLHQHDDDGYALSGTTGTYTTRLTANDAVNVVRYVLDDQLNPAAGTYAGSIHDTGLSGPQYSLAQVFITQECATPLPGSPMPREQITAPGGTALFTTNYPYAPGSLIVWYATASGSPFTPIAVTETNPGAGTFTTGFTPPAGAILVVEYQASYTSNDPTGANNPSPSTTTVTPGSGTFTDPMTTRGDIIVRNASNVTARLAIGAAGKILSSDGTDPSWGNGPMTTAADLIVGGTAGAPARLAKGSDSQVLTIDPTTHLIVWATPSSGFSNPMTTKGDVIVGDTGGTAIRKAVGSDGQVLTADSASTGGIKWGASASTTVQYPDLKPGTPTDDFNGSSFSGWTVHSSGGSLTTGHVKTQTEDGSHASVLYSAQMGAYYQTHSNGDLDISCGDMHAHGLADAAHMIGIFALDSAGTGIAVLAYDDGLAYFAAITTWGYASNSDSWATHGLLDGRSQSAGHWFRLKRVSGTWTGYVSQSGRVWDKTFSTRADSITVDRVGFGMLYNTGFTYSGRLCLDYFQVDV